MLRLSYLAVAFLATVNAHITMLPNDGAVAGTYFFTTMRVPHAIDGFWTTKLEITVPDGVLSLTPEKVHGWDITVEKGPITPYVSHGSLVSEGPVKVTYEAELSEHALHDEHLLQIGLSMKIGCNFTDSATATTFNGVRTLWFPIVQHLAVEDSVDETNNLVWTGVGSGSGHWHMLQPQPAAFVQLAGADGCEDASFHGAVFNTTAAVSASQAWVSEEMTASRASILATVEHMIEDHVHPLCYVDEGHDHRRRLSSDGCASVIDPESGGSSSTNVAFVAGLTAGLVVAAGGAAALTAHAYKKREYGVPLADSAPLNADNI